MIPPCGGSMFGTLPHTSRPHPCPGAANSDEHPATRAGASLPYPMDIASIHNNHEKAVFAAVQEMAEHFPHVLDNADMLADIACVALNRLPPRYIRHDVDFAFFQTDRERTESERSISEAVEFAFGFVQARNAMKARA